MKPNELRIGNSIFDESGNVSIVDSVGCHSNIRISNEHLTRKSHNLSESEISPIPLTEEWLLKFGFEKFDAIGGSKNYRLYPIHLNSAIPFFAYIYNNDENEGGFNLGNIQFVHQLQNLFYSLTGEELKTT